MGPFLLDRVVQGILGVCCSGMPALGVVVNVLLSPMERKGAF